ncbi:hypothetical protein [Fervidobacterium pennivorans]|uniref:hypothetical protein n=1 Tax=Fervidobacterium pennivorans TaxID=93466 RepID=UPI001436AD7E|nr:hypothetical protein [Fervidobacterium pennivorans]QIV78978.1 hypothetical protein HER11_08640 [Fervidobacterium pennivorans subsp. keratinolyticus]
MAGKRYLIATACNKKYEDFVLNHWFRSLKDNVDLSETDVLIMDYGLSKDIVQKLSEQGAIVRRANREGGLINNTRFLELADFLKENSFYEQVILCDSGDIIFQDDFSHLFKENTTQIRAVTEDFSPNMDMIINEAKVENADEIRKKLWKKQLINAGFVVYPRDVYIDFVERTFSRIKDIYAWGVDMILLNYYAYENGFFKLPVIYNFIPTTARVRYKIENGIFYIIKNGEKIKVYVVHNAGAYKAFRPVLKFGYGKDFNIPRPFTIFTLRMFYISLYGLRHLISIFFKR